MNLDYQKFLDQLMRDFIHKLLVKVAQESLLASDYYFSISFATTDPLVTIPRRVQERHLEEVTIIFQHQFDNLIVTNDGFSVTMSFDDVAEIIKVPFRAINAFADRNAKFRLYFTGYDDDPATSRLTSQSCQVLTDNGDVALTNVITLDKFRSKNKPS